MAYQSTLEDKQRALVLGVVYVLLAITLGYMLFKIWPPVPWPDPANHRETIAKAMTDCGYAAPTPTPTPTPSPDQIASNSKSEPVAMPMSFFFTRKCVMTTFDERLLLLVIVAGMLGSFVHTATSLADYIGNNRFSRRWTWFYLLRPVIGMALALIFYFVIRGGFLTTNVGATDINPYGIAALAGLVGMFSKQATDKLSEVFSTLFRSGEGDQKREQPLSPSPKGVPTKVEPPEVTVGSDGRAIVVTGTDFVKDSVVYLDELPQTTTFDSATQLTAQVKKEVFVKPAVLKLTIESPDGTRSAALELRVVPAITSPRIDNVDPPDVTPAVAGAITVNGAGFVDRAIVKINDEPQETLFIDSTKLTVNLTATSIAKADTVKVKVENPDGTASNEVDLTAG